jgi:polyhydroxybutyrate depolymerase
VYTGLPAKGDEAGFIVVTPDATGEPAAWNLLSTVGRPDDFAFIGDLLDHIEQDLCVDATRVFAAGMSNGAAFASRLGCVLPERIDAVAAVTALIYPRICPTQRPMPVIAFHGTADPCVPFAGGVTMCGSRLPIPAIEDAAMNWARHSACDETPALTQLSEHVRVIAYSDCAEDAAVVLYVVEGGGHTWPGSFDVPRLGETTHEISASDLIWEFFAAHGNIR